MLYLIATGDFSGPTDNHLSFTKGTKIEFLERVENGFIKGKMNGKVGIFPSSLITVETRPLSIMSNQPLKLSSDDLSSQSSTPPGSSPMVSAAASINNSNSNSFSSQHQQPTTTTTTTTSTSTTMNGSSSTTNESSGSKTPSSSSTPISNTIDQQSSSPNTNNSNINNSNSNSISTSPPTNATSPNILSASVNSAGDLNEASDDSSVNNNNNNNNNIKDSNSNITPNSSQKIDDDDDGSDDDDNSDFDDRKSTISNTSMTSNMTTLTTATTATTATNATGATSAKREKKDKKDKNSNGEKEGLYRKSKSSSSKKRYANRKQCETLTVACYEDLPEEIRIDMQKEDIDLKDIKDNFKIYLTILKFITRQRIILKTPNPALESQMSLMEVSDSASTYGKYNDEKLWITDEVRCSQYDTQEITVDESIMDENERKSKIIEAKLERKRLLSGTTTEFLGHASTTIKLIPPQDIKKRIKFGEMLGKGTYSRVFEATYDKKKVAIKVMKYSTPKEQNRVLTEIGFLSKCKHANILTYKASALYGSDIFVITEHIIGGTLETAVASSHAFKETQIGYIGAEILKALLYLHNNKIVHRDVKSANIMITLNGEVKLIDFGLCANVSQGGKKHMVGAPYWMAPEMVRGEEASYAADVWSFGICMLEMLYKKPPHRDSRMKAMFTNTTKGIDFGKIRCSIDLKDMLWQCFELNPAKRSNVDKLLRHPFFRRAESKSGMKGIFDNIFLQKNLNTTGFFY